MAIQYFGPGDHPAGWTGWRVVVPAGNKRNYQAYFTDKPEADWKLEDWLKRQELRAQIYDYSRQCRALLRQYRNIIRFNDRRTPAIYGVAASGIRLFAQARQRALGGWVFGFQVTQFPNLHPLRIVIGPQSYSEAWTMAVAAWAKHHGVRPQDAQDLLRRQPDPKRFKELRRYLNEHKGKDIPVEALRPVFAEQRQSLEHQKAQKALQSDSLEHELASLYTQLSKDIERQKATN